MKNTPYCACTKYEDFSAGPWGPGHVNHTYESNAFSFSKLNHSLSVRQAVPCSLESHPKNSLKDWCFETNYTQGYTSADLYLRSPNANMAAHYQLVFSKAGQRKMVYQKIG